VKWKGLYTVLLLICINSIDVVCQGGDSIICDSGKYTIVLNCIPTLDGMALNEGDEIYVLSNITDVAQQVSSINYLRDSLNTFPLSGSVLLDSSPDNTNLEFSVNSNHRKCKSNKIQFTSDRMNSSDCVLSIDSFQAENHFIDYMTDVICTTDDLLVPFSDIPDNDFVLNSYPNGLSIKSNGEINPRESSPGVYMLNFSSDYCLSADSVIVEIAPSLELGLADTLPICTGSDRNNLPSNITDVQFYNWGSSDAIVGSELSESGTYIAISAEGPCPSVDTVYVDLLDQPVIDYTTLDLCDRVTVSMNVPAERNYSVNWSNDVVGLVNTVYNDTVLLVDLKAENGCIARDSIDVKINRLTLNSMNYQKVEADCWTDGQLTIEAVEVDNYVGGYEYRLYNKLTNQLLSNLNEVPEGVYSLRVVDDRGCVAEYEQDVKVEQKCLEDYPAFSPDGDNIEDIYFIPHEGTVSIYNRNGILLKELETPAYWDGTDSENHPMPMGNYLLITDKGRTVNITIIR
jgi:hypothetical protein